MPMTRVTSLPVAVVVCVAGFVAQTSAQVSTSLTQAAGHAAAYGELQGVVTDDVGAPLAGAVVSALGSTTAFSVTDRAGRFSFHSLPPGPYIVRAHLEGYVPARARVIQVNSAGRATSSIALARRARADQPQVVAAGTVGTDGSLVSAPDSNGEDHDHGEIAWRLRHLKRSVLKDSDADTVVADDDSSWADSFETIGRAMGHSARLATSFFTELPVSGEVNFLTTRSFDQPQELFSAHGAPRGIALISLKAPTGAGDWNIRGAMTQGDLASWLVAGSYVRRAPAAHQYEAGLLYSMQRYEGGNPAALAAVADGTRNAGAVYAYDRWTVRPGLALHYGARYARYDYLADEGLFSPRVGLTLTPNPVLRLRVSVSRRETAPGAEEFVPQDNLSVWMPPERTFSPLSSRRGFRPERLEHYEVAAEHDIGAGVVMGARAFRQRVDDQIVTLFGVTLPQRGPADVGHYYVASAGNLETHGWGVSVSGDVIGRVRGSVDYTQTEAEWQPESGDWRLLSLVARSAYRSETERLHDLTTSLETEMPVTATRVYVLYKLNSGFAAPEAAARTGRIGTRFDVQISQALPFMNFTATQWEMLFTVRNLFRDDLIDASTYDELLVVKPPKRIVGGLTVRF